MARESAQAVQIKVSKRQRRLLEAWVRKASETPHRFRERCRIVLMSADGVNNEEQGRRLGVDRQRIRRWRARWLQYQPQLAAAEAGSVVDGDLAKLLKEALGDAARPGAPTTCSAEQVAQIIS